jgi:hypothetical protein
MRQCLACPTTYADDLTMCPACNGTRSARIAGAAAAGAIGGAADGVASRVKAAVHALLWDKEWTPNGVRWSGASMVLLEAPALLALPSVDGIQFLMVIPWMILISGLLIVCEVGGEWSEWLGRIFCGAQLLRTVRGLIMGTLFDGVGIQSLAMLLYCIALGGILGLLAQGYSHPKSPRLIRIVMPILTLNVVVCLAAWAMQEAPPPELDEDEPLPAAPTGPTKNNSPFDQIPEDAGKPPKPPELLPEN